MPTNQFLCLTCLRFFQASTLACIQSRRHRLRAHLSLVEVSVGVVHAHRKDGVHIEGVCSNYLARLKPMQKRACVSIRTSSFWGPKDILNTPMIMVGAGTGLAPMVGFLEVKFALSVIGDESYLRSFVFSLRCYLSQLESGACYGILP